MNADDELRQRVRKAQDDSWEEGYFAGRDGDTREPPEAISWPSQWRIGYDAAVEDRERRERREKREREKRAAEMVGAEIRQRAVERMISTGEMTVKESKPK